MLNKPSTRRKSSQHQLELNLVPMLDALVTIVSFLLFSTAFMAIVVIDTPAPVLGTVDEQVENLKTKPLQLTAHIQAHQIIVSDWSGSREKHVIASITDPASGEPKHDIEQLHKILIEIKTRYPEEKKLILKPDAGIPYETIVEIMDSARFLDPKTDPPSYKKNEQGVDVPTNELFPEVIFGNIMS